MNLVSNGASTGHVKAGHAKGFTLIELLVVIAIIGILSAVVLASLSTARTKGKDASIQESMSGMRAAMEIYYGNNGNKYAGGVINTCNGAASGFVDTTSNMKGLLDSVSAGLNGAAGTYTNMTCGVTAAGDAWAVSSKLPSGTVGTASGYFCVDSTGKAGAPASVPAAGATVCP